jgi:hypothetical protein
MKRGICKMCLLEKDLVSSHLIPAALYHYLRHGNATPIRVGDGVIFPTDRETQDYLLCLDCEDTLNKGGESWVNSKLCTVERKFPLHDLVTNGPVAAEDRGDALYFAALNPLIDVPKLVHFGMGIFWKAAVHSWRGNTTEPMIELGPYCAPLRKWLKGESDFPKWMFLWVTLSRPDRAQLTLNVPVQTARTGWKTFHTHMLGLIFMLNVGKGVPFETKESCFRDNPDHPILVSEDLTAILEKSHTEQYWESRKTHSYSKRYGGSPGNKNPA